MRYDTIDAGAEDLGHERRLRDVVVLLVVFGATFLAFGLVQLIG